MRWLHDLYPKIHWAWMGPPLIIIPGLRNCPGILGLVVTLTRWHYTGPWKCSLPAWRSGTGWWPKRVEIQASPVPALVTPDKLYSLSGPQFPHLSNGGAIITLPFRVSLNVKWENTWKAPPITNIAWEGLVLIIRGPKWTSNIYTKVLAGLL